MSWSLPTQTPMDIASEPYYFINLECGIMSRGFENPMYNISSPLFSLRRLYLPSWLLLVKSMRVLVLIGHQLLMTKMSYVSLRIKNSVNAVQAERLLLPMLGTEMAGRPPDASQSILFYSAWRFYALAAGPQQGKFSLSCIKSFSTWQGQGWGRLSEEGGTPGLGQHLSDNLDSAVELEPLNPWSFSSLAPTPVTFSVKAIEQQAFQYFREVLLTCVSDVRSLNFIVQLTPLKPTINTCMQDGPVLW